ncbi:MAG: aminoacyl-tRNA hydrolase [SAR324 cluster bacterium]|nr:aminoacyl-tRNA hydrolase [SAR324 cluster bacterium]
MRLIAGLGNPGREYENTPHNAGFEAVDQLARQFDLPSPQNRFQGLMQRGSGPEPFLLLKPQTYMNRSGVSVAECLRFFKIAPEDLVVVSDDLDLPPGRVRLRASGSHGGHNGLRSIIEQLGTEQFRRARIGIGHPQGERSVTGHVLGRWKPEDEAAAQAVMPALLEALTRFLRSGAWRDTTLAAPPPVAAATTAG